LLAKIARTPTAGPTRLFVVKVVAVVELPAPPMTVRDWVPEDCQ
jgi:hypothetical protein